MSNSIYNNNNKNCKLAEEKILDIIDDRLLIEDIYNQLQPNMDKRYNNYVCLLCGNISVRMYGDNSAYCHACNQYMTVVDIYRYTYDLSYCDAIIALFKDQFNVSLSTNNSNIVHKDYMHWLHTINYTRLLSNYIDYFAIKNFSDYIDEYKPIYSNYINFYWSYLTKKQIKRIYTNCLQVISYQELLYFALYIQYKVNNDINLFKVLKIYCKQYSDDMWDRVLNNINMTTRTYYRLIAGNNVRNVKKYKLLLCSDYVYAHLIDYINKITSYKYDIDTLKFFLRNKIIK